MRTILVENSKKVEEFITLSFRVGWPDAKLVTVNKAGDAINLIEKQTPDLVIIEPDEISDTDGFNFVKQIRLFSDIPIVILTAINDETSVVKGLELGADEYIKKPIGSLELLARVRALMRRQLRQNENLPLVYSNFCLYPTSGELSYRGKKASLTRAENIIFQKLMQNSNRIVTCSSISRALWGDEYPDCAASIRSHIRRLRAKLKSLTGESDRFIHTKSGVGYSLVAQN